MDLIKCEDLSFSYDGNIVLKNVNFSVKQNDYLCIIGENGSGKSTLIKGLLQLKKPSNGKIIYEGITAKDIGYLPQQSIIQRDFIASVFEVVISGCLNSLGFKPFYGKKEKSTAIENLNKLDIYDLKDKCYAELSGGQQQRVLLARALCATRKIIILDEPVSGLDPYATKELYELIKKVNKNLNITVVIVSHDIEGSIQYSNKILHLDNEQLFFGDTNEYLSTALGQKYIGDKRND